MQNNLIYEVKPVTLKPEDLMVNETIFHNANGYIGIRSNFEEGYPKEYDSIRGAYINGFYDFSEMKQAEKLCGLIEEKQTMLNVADPQTIYFRAGDEEFSMFEGEVLESSRVLNMEEGYTLRHVVWRSLKGAEFDIRIRRMASFVQQSLFTIEYTVTSVNYDGEITFISEHKGDVRNYSNPHDPRVARESVNYLVPRDQDLKDGASYLLTETSKSGLMVCTGVKGNLSKEGEKITNLNVKEHRVDRSIKTDIQKGETVTYTQYVVFTDSIRSSDCKKAAEEEMDKALREPLTRHYDDQKSYLEQFWESSDVDIEGDDDLCRATKYNMYQLVQSVSKDRFGNIAAKGLSGEGYEGHFFWDTEMFMHPFFVLTNPKLAKNLVAYRYEILEQARENARILGHQKGALYPWRTIMGKECSGYFPSGSAAYHINGDIAYSVVSYYLATKDIGFLEEKGAEILFETARLWMDTGNYVGDKFHINEVTGPDEYTCMVNNNYFTNAAAKYNLYWAANSWRILKKAGMLSRLAEKLCLSEEEIAEFEKAGKAMYLPYDEELGINPQDDSFLQKKVWDLSATPKDKFPLLLHYHPLYIYRHQVCKQADTVLAHFIFEDEQELETIRKSFAYYEKITTHDSSLSTCIFSIVACRLGLVDKAYDYFGDSAKLDLFNTHHNTKDGIHTANMGGNYMAIVYGFGGLRIKESGLYLNPVLPKQWNAYRFKIRYMGRHLLVRVTKEGTSLSLLSGSPVELWLNGENITVS